MYKTTIGIEGMGCPMCESQGNDAIRDAISNLHSIHSSYRKKICAVQSDLAPSESAIKHALADTGYIVTTYATEWIEPKNSLITKLKRLLY